MRKVTQQIKQASENRWQYSHRRGKRLVAWQQDCDP